MKKEKLHCFLKTLPESLRPEDIAADSQNRAIDFALYQILRNTGKCFTSLRNGKVEHDCLESSSVSLDGLTYRFTLKKGIYFHCGKELSASDAIACFERVYQNKHSASQLHRYAAFSKKKGLKTQKLSKFRFELQLENTCTDLLARLSHIEFTLTHPKCGSQCGDWVPQLIRQSQNKNESKGSNKVSKIELTPHTNINLSKHPAIYEKIIVKKYDPNQEFELLLSEKPCLYLLPGDMHRKAEVENLSTTQAIMLDSGQCIGLYIPSDTPDKNLKNQLLSIIRQSSFKSRSPLRKWLSFDFLPKGHALHFNLSRSQPSMDTIHRQGQTTRILDRHQEVDDLLKRQWENKSSQQQLSLSFTANPKHKDGVDAEVLAVPYYGMHDIWTPIQALHRSGVISFKSDLPKKSSQNQAPAMISQTRNTLEAGKFLPLIKIPLVAQCNRIIAKQNSKDFLDFSSILGSAENLDQRKFQDKTLKAIGIALPMLVHDIKKPFSMMYSILELLEANQRTGKRPDILNTYLPQIKRQIKNANQLMQDILEISSDSKPYMEYASLAELIQSSLTDLFDLEPQANINFTYDLQHHHLILGDIHKLACVIINILTNAVQAMGSAGNIWFRSSENKKKPGQIIFTIGNDGELIPESELETLFDRFYTKEKRGGTGLGLAIVHKIISLHGGSIYCTSSKKSGVEFHMTLPASDLSDNHIAAKVERLPESLHERRPNLTSSHLIIGRRDGSALDEVSPKKSDTPDACPPPKNQQQSKIVIISIDDDEAYSGLIHDLLRTPDSPYDIEFHATALPEVFEKWIQEKSFHMALVDAYINSVKPNGLKFARAAKVKNPACIACLHSSGNPMALQRAAVQEGLDIFLPKPMTYEHILNLIKLVEPTSHKNHTSLPHLIVIDDDPLIIECWQSLSSVQVKAFQSPSEFIADLQSRKLNLSDYLAIVCDQYFGAGEISGTDLASKLNAWGETRNFFISSELKISPVPEHVDGQLSKTPALAWQTLQSLV